MVKKLDAVTLSTLEPEDVRVCRDCGMVHVEERGCPLCAFLAKGWKLKNPEKKPSTKEMIDWLYTSEDEESEEGKGFWG